MSAAELEVVVMSKLELAAIANQRHHSAMAARIVLVALHMLQTSKLFHEKKEGPPIRRYHILLLMYSKFVN